VFPNTFHQIADYADVKRAIAFTGEDIDARLLLHGNDPEIKPPNSSFPRKRESSYQTSSEKRTKPESIVLLAQRLLNFLDSRFRGNDSIFIAARARR
jgi:hypothetical protein